MNDLPIRMDGNLSNPIHPDALCVGVFSVEERCLGIFSDAASAG